MEHEKLYQWSPETDIWAIQWFGGSDSELGVSIFPMESQLELRNEFPNHISFLGGSDDSFQMNNDNRHVAGSGQVSHRLSQLLEGSKLYWSCTQMYLCNVIHLPLIGKLVYNL